MDMIEYLAAHFAHDPDFLADIHASTGGLPSTLHSYEYMMGSVERPPAQVVDRLQRMAAISDCRWIGEHIGMVGTADTYAGTFLQPFGTDEQTEQFIVNLRAAAATSVTPFIVENQPQVFAQIGPRGVCRQVADVATGADCGILLSLSNIIISDSFFGMDREKEIAAIPLDRVWQIHLPVPSASELGDPGLARLRDDTRWAYATLEQLAAEPDFRPAAIILEVQAAGTPSRATPEEIKDRLIWAREMMQVKEPAVGGLR
ncbi:multinuclear nonheme iron-dependent oxidase [Actinoplanes sp. CA-252034]|uniref:multinuclear nonheme iron-dependent oxidase n=1 Tax=Actinoplanes sp. CA-252034 TaxID=3239906 RepID=UPI003D99CFFA